MWYFYWLRVKNSNHFRTELSLGYLEDAKFYLESKASFIDISSIVSFKLVLIAWLREYCTFSDSSAVLGQNPPSWELFSKKVVFHYQTFFSLSNSLIIHAALTQPEHLILDEFRNPMKNELKTRPCLKPVFEIISNADANFINLHIGKETKTRGDKQLFNHTFYETNFKFKPKLFTAKR